ncbi:MAG TPA: hypothetical protein VIT19_00650 [Pyrinomonadaceae bacterium]
MTARMVRRSHLFVNELWSKVADMAEGGGSQPEKLSEALQASYGVIERMLS